MPVLELGGMTLGLREGVIAMIVLVAAYMVFVVLRMRRLRKATVASPETSAAVALPAESPPPAAEIDEQWAQASAGIAGNALRSSLEQEFDQLRDEVDAMRGELAALRNDMLQELAHLRASQTVSPIYGDAMQMAASGYDPVAIAERCGIARAEAELVVALAKSQER